MDPADMVAPADPVVPADLVAPADMVVPADPVVPVDPHGLPDPGDPIDSIWAADHQCHFTEDRSDACPDAWCMPSARRFWYFFCFSGFSKKHISAGGASESVSRFAYPPNTD